ncbi:hypothetical protein Tco_0363152 [Tanacetum coccineum]
MFKRRLIAADQASVFMAMMSVHISSGLVLHQMTSDHNRSELGIQDHSNEPSSSKLVPKVVPLAVKTATSRQELELLFHHHIAMLRTTDNAVRMRTRSARRPAAESLGGGTGERVGRGGRGRRPRNVEEGALGAPDLSRRTFPTLCKPPYLPWLLRNIVVRSAVVLTRLIEKMESVHDMQWLVVLTQSEIHRVFICRVRLKRGGYSHIRTATPE